MVVKIFSAYIMCVVFVASQRCDLENPLTTDFFQFSCKHMIYHKDSDNNHQVTPEEYGAGNWYISSEEVIEAQFLIIDTNGDGVFNATDEPAIFDRMDVSKNRGVDITEYHIFWNTANSLVGLTVLFERTKQNYNVDALTKEQFKELFSSLSTQSDGSVSKDDLSKAYTSPPIDNYGGFVEETLDVFDKNNDDVITKAEVGSLFNTLDKNGDEEVDYVEFTHTVYP